MAGICRRLLRMVRARAPADDSASRILKNSASVVASRLRPALVIALWVALVVAQQWLIPLSGTARAQAIDHDALMRDDIQSTGRSALAQDALKRAQGAASGERQGSGPEVDLNIAFPPNQTGLGNVNVIRLVPTDAGAHEAEALAQVRGTSIYSVFISAKGLQPGHTYIVVACDAVNDNYPIGRVSVGAGGRQVFRLDAPLLTPDSPQLGAFTPGPAIAPPAPPPVGREPGRMANNGARMPPWVMGIGYRTITPAMLAAVGHPESHLRGLLVLRVVPGSPADRAGIRVKDVILAINGHPCGDQREVPALVENRRQGAPTDLYIYSQRAKALITVRVPVDMAFVPPPNPRGYVPPKSGPGFVQPPIGPGFRQPGTSAYQPPREERQSGGTDSKYGMRRTQPPPRPVGNTGWKPPTVGSGFVEPSSAAGQSTKPRWQPVQPVRHTVLPMPTNQRPPVHPTPPPQGSSTFKQPSTGPGFKQPGSN